jgi:small subunit ribosomal protein S9
LVNGKKYNEYFKRPVLQLSIEKPFNVIAKNNAYDVMCTVKGGGLTGQAGAVSLGISKALYVLDGTLRKTLKKEKLLTRDSRKVERKKYGQKKARRRFQFSKR